MKTGAMLKQPSARPRVLLTTEGTYPYAVGGPSTWCDLLMRGLPEVCWQVLPLVAGGKDRVPRFELPEQATLLPAIRLWSDDPLPWRPITGWRPAGGAELPGWLASGLLGWDCPPSDLVEALVWCREHPHLIGPAFRDRQGWASFVRAVRRLANESNPGLAVVGDVDASHLGVLYQTLYWVARTAAHPTPACDVVHVTAAGWAAIPALVHKARHRTPLVLTEHGVYVREAYLAGLKGPTSATARFVHTLLARNLARATYHWADTIVPVTGANRWWEEALGASPARIRVVYNGIPTSGFAVPEPLPGRSTVVSVGRLDPLKDIHTLLHVAAEVLRVVPEARFLHSGPVSEGEGAYARSCHELHRRLGLGERFRFLGYADDLTVVLRMADVVLTTSISEGIPLTALEAMLEGRPVVGTCVGGVEEGILGGGVVAPPGDVHGLAMGVVTLLRNPALAQELGRRGRARVQRKFDSQECNDAYRDLLAELLSTAVAA